MALLHGPSRGSEISRAPRSPEAPRSAPTYTARVRIAVLGPVQAVRDGADLDLGPHKQRALLAGLVLHAGRVVPVETLTDLLWGDAPPAAVQASLHGYVAALRRVLEPGRAARSSGSLLVTRGSGYLLDVPPDAVDGVVFTRRITDAHRLLGGDALAVAAGLAATDLEAIDEQLAAALALWRGQPYAELPGAPDADAERARLAELRSTAEVDRGRIGLAMGRPAEVAAALTPTAHEQPLREDVWALLALALARAGRQADSLQALTTVKTALADELGIDPGPVLANLELAVLRQDPAVVGAGSPPSTPPPPAAQPGAPPVAATVGAAAPRRQSPSSAAPPSSTHLSRLLDRARHGRTQFSLLVGEPGIGKSRLTSHFAAPGGRGGLRRAQRPVLLRRGSPAAVAVAARPAGSRGRGPGRRRARPRPAARPSRRHTDRHRSRRGPVPAVRRGRVGRDVRRGAPPAVARARRPALGGRLDAAPPAAPRRARERRPCRGRHPTSAPGARRTVAGAR